MRSTALATLVVLLVLLCFALLLSARNVVAGVFLGLLLATALRPIVTRLRSLRVPSFVAAGLAVMLLLGGVVGAVVLIVPLVAAQASAITAALPTLYSGLRNWLLSSDARVLRQIGYRLEPELRFGEAGELGGVSPELLGALANSGYVLFLILCTLLFTYHWLLYRERSLRSLLLLLPMERREATEAVWLQIESRIGAFLRGQALLSVITAGFSLIAYLAVGMPFALLLAVIAGILELIPFLGPFIATGVAVAVGLSDSPERALAALAVGVVIQQLENNFLAPRIMDKAVGISPVVTLLAFVGFAALFGPSGALLAIPLAAALQVLFVAWIERRNDLQDDMLAGRSIFDRLRYDLRDLTSDISSYLRQKEGAASVDADEPEESIELILQELDTLLAEAAEPSAPATTMVEVRS